VNILFIWPPDIYGKYGRLGKQWLPLGLGTMASYLRERQPGVNIRILCPTLERLSFEKVADIALSGGWDVIGVSYITVQAPYAFRLSEILKKQKKSLLVHGGIHATVNYEEALNSSDICVLSEGEETFHEIVDSLRNGSLRPDKIKGIAFKEKDNIRVTPARPFINDLDKIPFPAYDLFPMAKYDDRLHVTNEVMVDIMESRGCPYNCSFCVSPVVWGNKIRWHSPQYIAGHMKTVMEKYGINNFHFHGDNFLMRPPFVEGLCKLILEEDLKVKWCALTRAEHINTHKELLPMMKKAGCVGIEVGIDSAEPEALEVINKGQKPGDVIESFRNQKEAGLTPLFTLMGFNPKETICGYYLQQRSIFREVLGYDVIRPGQTSTPYPGTEYWRRKDELGMVLAENWEEFDHKLIPFVPFSLLKGRPRRIQEKLHLNEIFIIAGTYVTYRVDMFSRRNPMFKNVAGGFACVKRLKRYYSLCSGQYSVEEISGLIAQDKDIKHREAVRFTAFATLMCAKMGLIRDENSEEMKKAAVEPFYSGPAERLKSVFRYIYIGFCFSFGKKEKVKSPW